MKAAREVAPWLLLVGVVWGGGLLVQRLRPAPPSDPLAPWQHSFRELPNVEQRTFRQLREALPELERARVADGRWPAPELLAALEPFREDEVTRPRRWTLRTNGPYATYLGLPTSAADERWLVLFIEPTTNEAAPSEDEEHHTLPDGRGVHVTVWSQPGEEPTPGDDVLAFPAAENWRQRVGR